MKASIIGSRRDISITQKVENICGSMKKYNIQYDLSYFEADLDLIRKDLAYTYNLVKKILQKCDVVVVESSSFNTGISLIIGRVIELKKPLLILVDKDTPRSINHPTILKAHSEGNNKIYYKEYTPETLDQIISEFAQKSRDLLNTKFLFNLSAEMAKYLQWSSEQYNRPMVDILRELLDDRMAKDETWQKHINS